MIKLEDAKKLTLYKSDKKVKRLCRYIDRRIKRTAKKEGLTSVCIELETAHSTILGEAINKYRNAGYKVKYSPWGIELLFLGLRRTSNERNII